MMDDSTTSANDSFYSKDTLITISDTDNEPIEYLPKLIPFIASLFQDMIEEDKSNNQKKVIRDIFHSSIIPSISIEDYLRRIVKYSLLDTASLTAAAIYINSLWEKNQYVLTYNNIYRLILAAIVISIKFNDDIVYKNSYYGKIGGVSLKEINYLEYQLLSYLNFNLSINLDYFKSYQQSLIHQTNIDEAIKSI